MSKDKTKEKQQSSGGDGIPTHPLAEHLQGNPSNHTHLVTLTGYPGKSTIEGHFRLYIDLHFQSYYELVTSDVVHHWHSVSGDDNAPTCVAINVQTMPHLVVHTRYQARRRRCSRAIWYHRFYPRRSRTLLACSGWIKPCRRRRGIRQADTTRFTTTATTSRRNKKGDGAMLSLDDAAPYLLERNLIDPEWILDGSLTIESAASRNANLKIEGPHRVGLFIKQPVGPADRGRESLSTEAAFYQYCQAEPAAAAMSAIVPRLVHHDRERCLIALRLLPGAVTLSSYLVSKHDQGALIEVAGSLGRALATVHGTFSGGEQGWAPRLDWLPRSAWAMTIHRPTPEVLSSQSHANWHLIRTLQGENEDGCALHLDALQPLWRVETLIHGDIRAANVLVGPDGESMPRLWIIDWELVQLGDPAWDLAGALQVFARAWVESIPMDANLSIDERADRATFPFPFVQRLNQSLWHGYQNACERAQLECDALLGRAVKYLAVRMIQSAYEISLELMTLDPRSVIMLQFGANVLSHPEVARAQLFGIPERE